MLSYYLQANEAQAVLEFPGRAGLAGRTAEAVARGLGRAQTSVRQPLSGVRPLGLTLEVSSILLWIPISSCLLSSLFRILKLLLDPPFHFFSCLSPLRSFGSALVLDPEL